MLSNGNHEGRGNYAAPLFIVIRGLTRVEADASAGAFGLARIVFIAEPSGRKIARIVSSAYNRSRHQDVKDS